MHESEAFDEEISDIRSTCRDTWYICGAEVSVFDVIGVAKSAFGIMIPIHLISFLIGGFVLVALFALPIFLCTRSVKKYPGLEYASLLGRLLLDLTSMLRNRGCCGAFVIVEVIYVGFPVHAMSCTTPIFNRAGSST